MKTRMLPAMAFALAALSFPALHSQEFKLLDRTVQVHGFASQGFIASNQNNWLSMNTSAGSFAMTDFGINISSQVNHKFHIGAQLYDRNIGVLGNWHPELDWAYGDYRFARWFGVRAGKVKTTFGLYSGTQDLNFVHPWAILPQSIYPLDLRASTMSHYGADIYGRHRFPGRGGVLAYNTFVGKRPNDSHGGYVLGLAAIGLNVTRYSGWVHGEDLRWNTPVKGLQVGAALMNQHITEGGVYHSANAVDPFLAPLGLPENAAYHGYSVKDDYSQFYAQYARGKVLVASEYRREWRHQAIFYNSPAGTPLAFFEVPLDQRSGYGSFAYQVTRRLQLGTYFSWYFTDYSQDLSLPVNHVYDRDITARYDVNPHLDLKLEGHFINGWGRFDSVRGFYVQFNPGGLKPETNAIVLRSGYNF